MKPRINIAIDGFAGCGKSTTARQLAARLGYIFIDSGAMYRAVALYLIQNDISCFETEKVINILPHLDIHFERDIYSSDLHVFLNGADVQSFIRTPEVSNIVSEVSIIPEVRRAMVKLQQKMGIDKGCVMDGRDIGTVVFPDAELKVFMQATLEARILRRLREYGNQGIVADPEDIKKNLLHRDHLDSTRSEGPLKKASDAKILDTSELSIEQQIDTVYHWYLETVSQLSNL